MDKSNQASAGNDEPSELTAKDVKHENMEARFVAISYIAGFIAFLTILIPGIAVLFGRDLDYFNLGFLASPTAFILATMLALGGIIYAKIAKETLPGILNILAVAFNIFLLWAHSMEGFLETWFGFIVFCAVSGIVFIIISIPTLKGIRSWIKELSRKTHKPVEKVRLWGHGILISMVFLGLAAFILLLLDNL